MKIPVNAYLEYVTINYKYLSPLKPETSTRHGFNAYTRMYYMDKEGETCVINNLMIPLYCYDNFNKLANKGESGELVICHFRVGEQSGYLRGSEVYQSYNNAFYIGVKNDYTVFHDVDRFYRLKSKWRWFKACLPLQAVASFGMLGIPIMILSMLAALIAITVIFGSGNYLIPIQLAVFSLIGYIALRFLFIPFSAKTRKLTKHMRYLGFDV